MNKLQKLGLRSGWARHAGQNLAEYGLVLGLVAVVAIGSLGAMGTMISDTLNNMTGILTGSAPANPSSNPMTPDVEPIPGGHGQDGTLNGGGNPESPPQENASEPGWEIPPQADPDQQPEVLPPAGGSSLAMDPAYQAWLAQNPQTANLIDQLSPEGQEIAHGVFWEASSGDWEGYAAINTLINHPALSSQDLAQVYHYYGQF